MAKPSRLKRLADLERAAGGESRVVVVMEDRTQRGMFSINPTGEGNEPRYAEAEVADHLPAGNLHLVWVRYSGGNDT